MSRRQCAKCPWRKDTDPHDIPNGYCVEKHKRLRSTIAEPGQIPQDHTSSGVIKLMACHETDEEPCVGWLDNQLGRGNNIPLRIHASMGRLDGWLDYEVVGPQHQSFDATLPK